MKKTFLTMILMVFVTVIVSQQSSISGETNVSPSAGDQGEKLTNNLGMTFVYISPGTFTMGSGSKDYGKRIGGKGPSKGYLPEDPDLEKEHRVTLTKGFYMQTTEATQGQWKVLMGSSPSVFKDCGDNCPVEKVSWNDVQAFIKKLNQQEGTDKYRLPTEAEWEYAARARTTTPFSTGECISADQAHYDTRSVYPGCPKRRGTKSTSTVAVAGFAPNPWGLYDMHGNVYEWCQDWFEAPYPAGPVTDPTGPSSSLDRVFRGGSWSDIPRYLRSASRGSNSPDHRMDNLGFRLVKDL